MYIKILIEKGRQVCELIILNDINSFPELRSMDEEIASQFKNLAFFGWRRIVPQTISIL